MTFIKKIAIALGTVIVIIQFIQPAQNKKEQMASDISNVVPTPDSIRYVLVKACLDCHSNNTTYPWYSHIQPMGWLIYSHIKEGKKELNFSEFGRYSARKQVSLMNGIANSLRDGNMPLASYTLLHRNAKLNEKDKALLSMWIQQSKDIISLKFHLN
jgi:hypothetical protein